MMGQSSTFNVIIKAQNYSHTFCSFFYQLTTQIPHTACFEPNNSVTISRIRLHLKSDSLRYQTHIIGQNPVLIICWYHWIASLHILANAEMLLELAVTNWQIWTDICQYVSVAYAGAGVAIRSVKRDFKNTIYLE